MAAKSTHTKGPTIHRADPTGAPTEYRGVPSKGEAHGHGHKYAAVPVVPTKKQ